jgi:hypothetical protein
MYVMRLSKSATIEVPDHNSLLGAWRTYGGVGPFCPVGRFIVKKPLTASQLKRLPNGLRQLISYPDGLGVSWFDELYRLEDPRG